MDFDARHTEDLLRLLSEYGYEMDTDARPVRMELYSGAYGYLDIHPFILLEDGRAKQADPEGGFYEFEKDVFAHAVFEGTAIPCISLTRQKLFHSGYEPREQDRLDLAVLDQIAESFHNRRLLS